MITRDLSLAERVEDVRDVRRIVMPLHFATAEIQDHFYDSMDSIKKQYLVADDLLKSGNETGCKIIWRSAA